MKKILFLFLFTLSVLINAQESYYNGIDFSKNGTALKQELASKTISSHTNFLSYTPGVWEASKATDVNPTNSAEILLIYGYSKSGKQARTRGIDNNGGNTGDWNREHTYPRSLGNPNLGSSGPGSDAHHLRPSDVQYNGDRGSKKFADGSGNSGDVSGGWYPGDEWKGDIARMMMYMYLRYGNQCLPSKVGIGSNVNTPDDMIDLFLEWNAEDPVSNFEKQRNVYHQNTRNAYAQGNRNPFIDNAYLATKIWGGNPAEDSWGIFTSTDNEAPSTPTNINITNITSKSFNISWTASIDNEAVAGYEIFLNGKLFGESSSTSFNATNLLPNTNYTITIVAKDLAGNKSVFSTAVNTTTTDEGNINVDEIFFSEYVEGSSLNKALEIVNLTNNTINLSLYSVKRQSKGVWEDPLQLSGLLNSNNVYVIINASTTNLKLKQESDLEVTNETPMTFNGNDRVGLFKNDTLIDIIGDLNGTDDFGKNITLRRKATITAPTTDYNELRDWNRFNSDSVDDIGSFNGTLSLDTSFSNNFKMYPNPNNGNTLFFSTTKDVYLEIINVLGKQVKSVQITLQNKNIDISDLSEGVYLVKITDKKQFITKKLVKN